MMKKILLKGGSLSRTEILDNGHGTFVRKSISKLENREYGLARWQSQLRKLQILNRVMPGSAVKIIGAGFNTEEYYFDLVHYSNCLNLYEAVGNGANTEVVACKIVEILDKFAENKFGALRGGLGIYIHEEIISPLNLALDFIDRNTILLTPYETNFLKDAIYRAIPNAEKLAVKFQELAIQETLCHGNLTLENMLWSNEESKIILIDPYFETYCDSVMGDLSQIDQSTLSGYEYVNENFENSVACLTDYPKSKIPEAFIDLSRIITGKVKHKRWYFPEVRELFAASQFTRMFPFKVNTSPRKAVLFMIHGIQLLEKYCAAV
jgi:hypothetical protein